MAVEATPIPPAASGYLSVDDADALAATMVNVGSYTAANTAAKAAALTAASEAIDMAMKYQGRKYDPTQRQEFPRIHDEGSAANYPCVPGSSPLPVWDWDPNGVKAVVPDRVKRACLYEANSILAGDRAGVLDAQHNGLASQAIGSASEFYRAAGPASAICRQAMQIMGYYRLRTGAML